MKMPLHIARKLQELQQPGHAVPGSALKHEVVQKMLDDGILALRRLSNTRSQVYLNGTAALPSYLHNHFGIGNLDTYIEKLSSEELSRAEAVGISGDSKLKAIRSFQGFMVNTYQPLECMLQGEKWELLPLPGSFTFINDYPTFITDPSVLIVGIENAENFAHINEQAYLFEGIASMFVCRYPQNNDLVKWLRSVPNPYLHFGDLDFAGINIYLNEFKKDLGSRARFFIPPQTETLLPKYGNRALYNKQLHLQTKKEHISEKGILQLLDWINQHHKVLEQEIFINGQDL